jgi:hypothetical protein
MGEKHENMRASHKRAAIRGRSRIIQSSKGVHLQPLLAPEIKEHQESDEEHDHPDKPLPLCNFNFGAVKIDPGEGTLVFARKATFDAGKVPLFEMLMTVIHEVSPHPFGLLFTEVNEGARRKAGSFEVFLVSRTMMVKLRCDSRASLNPRGVPFKGFPESEEDLGCS